MDQKSNVQYRAEKEYKNTREKFSFLLREIISNSIHAVLIRQGKEANFLPKVELNISFNEEDAQCEIILTDNGEGFTDINRGYFEELDKRNIEKEKLNFHPLGQGRLAIVYFSDFAEYETVYKDKDGCLKKRRIPYPDTTSENGLFSFELFSEENSMEKDSFTKLRIEINKRQSFGRAKTFFSKYPDAETFKKWFVETFFPFIVSNVALEIVVQLNGSREIIKKNSIENETETISFQLPLKKEIDETDNEMSSFVLWLIKKNEKNHGENPVVCFARNLRAELSEGKLIYSIDNNDGYLFYLTSNYFDEQVDTKGEKINISDVALSLINSKLNEVLDERFKSVITENKKLTNQNLNTFKKQFPSLKSFFIEDEAILSGKNIIKEDDIIKIAVEEKSKIEKKFWTHKVVNTPNEENDKFDDSIECQKLLNSSLHIYVQHRERVLKQLYNLIQTFDENGNDKPELESKVHELFFKRGTTLKTSENINHLHNLWILDDKFTIFSNNFKAESTKQGQSLSDIYIWADNPQKTNQVLILELKSTTKAHNAGNREEGMIAQVKRYAQDFYQDPKKVLNWDVDTQNVQYIGIILARKSDINKELSSNNVSGGFAPIPFLTNSYYNDESFSIGKNPMDKKSIRIELYSFEDIYELAFSRNEVFFKLLENEFGAEEDD